MMKLAADAVVLLLGPDLVRAHSFECFCRSLDRAREHEANGLEQGHRARLELAVLDLHRSLADISGDEVDAFHLRHRHAECLGDGGFYETFAQADAHLAGDHLDDEPGGLRMKAAQQVLERRGFGCSACGTDRVQRLLDIFERRVLVLRASIQRLARPVAEVRVLPEDALQVVLIAP